MSLIFPAHISAQNSAISRRDGFVLLWQSIQRPVLENREKPFADVPKGAAGSEEITYARYRGIIDDDDEEFRPDDALLLDDALLWLLRTRNVDDIEDLTRENLPALLEHYPIEKLTSENARTAMTENSLLELMRSLDSLLLKEDHEVSLYSEKFHGKDTAFGETFDMHAMTAAHRTFPHNTLVKVTNLRNGKSVTVRINDRGPFVDGRDMDLSLGAFTGIEDRSKGIFHATFQRLGDATLVNQCAEHEPRRAIRITKNVRLIGGVPATLSLGESLTLHSTRPFVVRSVRYPDGNVSSIEDWILPDEAHEITPSMEGEYIFELGTIEGRRRKLVMMVVSCPRP